MSGFFVSNNSSSPYGTNPSGDGGSSPPSDTVSNVPAPVPPNSLGLDSYKGLSHNGTAPLKAPYGVPVFVGTEYWNNNLELQQHLEKALKLMMTGDFMKFLSNHYSVANVQIGTGDIKQSVHLNYPTTDHHLNDTVFCDLLKHNITGKSPNDVYVFYPAPGSDTKMPANVIAYHTFAPDVNNTVYAVVPAPSGWAKLVEDNEYFPTARHAMTVATSHEVAEAVTNPLIGGMGEQHGWITTDNNEIADKCSDQGFSLLEFGSKVQAFDKHSSYHDVRIQQIWDPITNNCHTLNGMHEPFKMMPYLAPDLPLLALTVLAARKTYGYATSEAAKRHYMTLSTLAQISRKSMISALTRRSAFMVRSAQVVQDAVLQETRRSNAFIPNIVGRVSASREPIAPTHLDPTPRRSRYSSLRNLFSQPSQAAGDLELGAIHR